MKVLVLMMLLLVGCSATPYSGAGHFASFDAQDFAALKADQFQARLVVDDFVKMQDVRLQAQIISTDGVQQVTFPLELISAEVLPVQRSWIFTTQARTRYLYRLNSEGLKQFATLQQSLQQGSRYQCDVKVLFAKDITDRPFKYTLKLLLDPDNGYITMIENQQIALANGNS